MATLPRIRAVAADVGIEKPPLRQLAVSEVQRPKRRSRIISPACDHAWPLPIEVGHAGEETVHAVTVAISPIANIAARRFVIYGGEFRSCFAAENGVIFRAGKNIAA